MIWKQPVIKKYRIPVLPLSALLFYIATIALWKTKVIPDPKEILAFLAVLYGKFGYFGLIAATFLEGIAYLGLYFPGSLIIALAVFLSSGSWVELLTISVIVAFTLTITAVINYFLGRYISSKNFWEKKEFVKESEVFSKGLFISMLHPDLLAFYFFDAGLERRNFKKIIYVPVFMVPYGFLFALFLSKLSKVAKDGLENPKALFVLILTWILASFVFEHRRRKNLD